jgi:hypothetical protein
LLLVPHLVAGCGGDVGGGGLDLSSGPPRNPTLIFNRLAADGWPVAEGRPASAEFEALTGPTRCEGSMTFVRSDAEVGWAFICVGMPDDLYREISTTFDGTPLIAGPLYLDSGNGDVVIFGLGWPADTSEKFARTLDLADTGTYLVPEG